MNHFLGPPSLLALPRWLCPELSPAPSFQARPAQSLPPPVGLPSVVSAAAPCSVLQCTPARSPQLQEDSQVASPVCGQTSVLRLGGLGEHQGPGVGAWRSHLCVLLQLYVILLAVCAATYLRL